MAKRLPMKALPSISVQILLAVLFTVISVLGVFSLLELKGLKQRETAALQRTGELTSERIANSLAYPLWNLNREQTERLVLDETGPRNVFRIQVYDENGELYLGKDREPGGAIRNIERGSAPAPLPPGALYSYSKPITFKGNLIGRVTVEVSEASLLAQRQNLRLALLLRLLLLAAVLSLVLFLTLRGLVIRPLSTLKAWVENLPRGTELKPPRFKRSGEINALGEAFGKLSFNLQKQHDELESDHTLLQQLNQRMHAEIEERNQAERRASELAYFLNKMREAVIVTDLENRFIYWNEGAQKTFGWGADEVRGKVADELFPEGPLAALEGPRRAVREVGEWHGELPNIDKQGRTFFTDSSWTLVRNADGEPEAVVSISFDITERKQAEDALHLSEARFSTIFNVSPYRMGIVRLRDGVILEVNDSWVRETGFQREEVIGHPVTEMDQWLNESTRTLFRDVLKSGQAIRGIEVPLRTRDGSLRFALASLELVELNGEPCFLWATNDITDRKQAEEALQESEEIFRTLAETVSAGIFIYRDSQFVYANPTAERLTGYSQEEFLHMKLADLIHPDFHEIVNQRRAARDRGEPVPPHSEDKILTKSGETRWMDVTAAKTSFLGKPAMIVTTFDITERKRAEEALRASEKRFLVAFEANPMMATISLLEDGRFLAVNDSFISLTGYSREEAVGRTALELGLWPNAEQRARLMRRLQEEGSVRNHEADLTMKRGIKKTMLISVEAIELEGQRCLLHSGMDITQRQQAESALRTSQKQLRALSAKVQSAREEEGTRIAREIHDELGSALTGLKWDLEKMNKTLSSLEHEPPVVEVRERMITMTRLIEETINTVRRISSELRPSILDDLGLVAAIEWQAQQFQERTGIEFVWKSQLETAELSRESATAVFRIFQEILTNVLRHSGASRITVELEKCAGHFDLKVQDNGRGISEHEQRHTRSLGLLGMKERALLVDGEVTIAGAPGTGTTVVVRVPATA